MSSSLRIAVAQPGDACAGVTDSVRAHAAIVREAACRLVVFPELSVTGYRQDADVVAADDARWAPLVEACARARSVAVTGAVVPGERSGEQIASLAVTGHGVEVVYRKMHLHPPEPDRFTAGTRPGVIEVDGWRFGLAICRDTGVPEHVERTIGQGVDGYLASTAFPAAESSVRDERLRAVAGRHQVWAAVANWGGPGSGGSGIWAPGGGPVVQAGTMKHCWVSAVLAPGPRGHHAGEEHPR